MKIFNYIFLFLIFLPGLTIGQNVSINDNGSNPDNSAMLDVSDTTRGILIPRMSETQRNNILNPASGLLIFQTSPDTAFYFNRGSAASPNWIKLTTENDSSYWSRIDTNLNYKTGYVGLGLDTPQAKLHLFGQGTFGTGTRIAFGDDYFIKGPNNGLNVHIGESGWYNNQDSDQLQLHGKQGQVFTVDGDLGPSDLDTAMFISNQANVGIGTMTPRMKLDVEGSIIASSYNLTGIPVGIDYMLMANNNGRSLLSSLNGTNSLALDINALDMSFKTGSSNFSNPTNMFLSSTGNLGLNTTSPTGRFQVDLDTGQFFINNNPGGTGIASNTAVLMELRGNQISPQFRYANTSFGDFFDQGLDSNGNFTIQYNDQSLFTFRRSGWFNIGYDTTGFRLFVGGKGIANTFARLKANSGQTGLWVSNDSSSWALFSDQVGGSLLQQGAVGLFLTNGSGLAWTVTKDGKMGIGTPNTPALELSIGPVDDDTGFETNTDGNLSLFTNGVERVRFDQNGRVGINNNTPVYFLDVTGDINASGSVRASGLALLSDKRFKTSIQNMDQVLPKVLALQAIYHEWDTVKFAEREFSKEKAIGLIAQEVQKQFPELVSEGHDGYLAVDYAKLSTVLLQAIKEQQFLIDQQNQNNEKQQYQIESLIEEVNLIKKQMQENE